jgi:hypothetical protein
LIGLTAERRAALDVVRHVSLAGRGGVTATVLLPEHPRIERSDADVCGVGIH